MTVEFIRSVLGWCSLINIIFLTISWGWMVFGRGFLFAMHGQPLGVKREDFAAANYKLIGIYKSLIVVFNLVPYVVLRFI